MSTSTSTGSTPSTKLRTSALTINSLSTGHKQGLSPIKQSLFLASTQNKGFAPIIVIFVVLALIGIGAVVLTKTTNFMAGSLVNTPTSQTKTNPYLGVPCISNPKVQFTHDFTEVDKIKSVEPTIITPGNSRHRAWLNISSGKVPVYAPVDSELVNGVYKNARGALDYDLHFQVSCEIWYLINHVTEPVDKIKNAFPETPQADTRTNPPFKEAIKVKSGELLGYTTGTPLAKNFDFGVFDLNHLNDGLPADEGSKYGKELNFICPFDVLPQDIKADYYKKIITQEKPFTNCKSILE